MNVDRYEIHEQIGQGSTGVVYRGHDPKLNRDVAVKIFTAAGDDTAVRRRFAREARALASLNHPNVLEIFDFGADDETLYLVTELVPGADLGRLVRERGPLPEPALVAVALELCSALVHAHGRGVIHRALKPENVLLARGRLVLTDFGIVKGFGAGQPLGEEGGRRQTAVVGVPGYTAPEQLEQKALDGRTDLFAFGVLLYFLASRKLPYEAENRDALLEVFRKTRPEPLQRLRPDVSMDVANLIHRCLQPIPNQRPESAERLRHSFQRVLERRGQRDARDLIAHYERDALMTGVAWAPVGFVEATGETPVPFRRTRRRHRRLLVAVALALVVGAGGLGAAVALGWRPELPRIVSRLLGR